MHRTAAWLCGHDAAGHLPTYLWPKLWTLGPAALRLTLSDLYPLQIRVPLSKEERKNLKAQRRAGLSGKALLDDFADDIADIVATAGAAVA